MPTVTRNPQTRTWGPASYAGPPNVGTRVRVVANRDQPYSEDNNLGEGEIVGVYLDSHLATRVAVVCFASPLSLSVTEGPLSIDRLGGPVTLSRLVCHADTLVILQPAEPEVIECPPCEVCGEPAHGDIEDSDPIRSMCDECAIDQDVSLVTWPEIRERQVRAENEVAETSPRRRRQVNDRVAAIEQGIVDSPHPAPSYVEVTAALDEATARQNARARNARARPVADP